MYGFRRNEKMSKRVKFTQPLGNLDKQDEQDLLLPYRTNADIWKREFETYFYDADPIDLFKDALKKTRCFIGCLFGFENMFRRDFNENQCYIEIATNSRCGLVFYVLGREFWLCKDTIEECIVYIEENQLVPLDRGKTPYFAPAAARLTRDAINAWCICANRMGVPRDLRRLIGEMMWAERHVWIP